MAFSRSTYRGTIFLAVAGLAVSFAVRLEATPEPKPAKPVARAFSGKTPLPSHKTHREFIDKCKQCKKDCTDCHTLDPKTDRYSLNKAFCKHCHEPSPPPAWILPKKARRLAAGVSFKHTVHQRARQGEVLKCRACHQSTIEDRAFGSDSLLPADDCFSCHAERRVALPEKRCGKCHAAAGINRNAPSSHDLSWLRRHGREAGWAPALGHGRRCGQCHQKAACVGCHRSQRPADHTGLWRVRTHGTSAKWNRDRCKTCHETGACISCHRRTPPLGHRGDWVSRHGRVSGFQDGCTVCHAPGWCAACHRGSGRGR